MRVLLLVLIVATIALGACDPGSPAGDVSSVDVAPSTYSDPFAYCAAVGTIDAPDTRYEGEEMPDAIIEGMIDKGIVTDDAPREFQEHAVWRCMDGEVWVCHFGANIPCLEQADMSQEPSAAMDEFCAANPEADNIPAAVTGRATVYAWRCVDGEAEAGEQVFTADPQGFLGEFWYELDSQQ